MPRCFSRCPPCAFLTAVVLALAILSGTAAEPAEGTSVPFEYRKGLIWIPVKAGEGDRELNFLLDTGAEQSVIDRGTAQKLGVRFTGSEEVLRVHGVETAYQTAPVRLAVGGQASSWTAPLLALNLKSDSRSLGRRIDGLLGMDYLADRVLWIDYEGEQLSIGKRAEARRGDEVVSITRHRGNPCIPVRVVDSSGTQLLHRVRIDTGCNEALHWSPSNGLSETAGPNPSAEEGKSIAFSSRRSRHRSSDVVLGSTRLSRVSTIFHPRAIFPGEHGLIGNPLLARWGVVTIDLATDRLILSEGE